VEQSEKEEQRVLEQTKKDMGLALRKLEILKRSYGLALNELENFRVKYLPLIQGTVQ